MSPPVINMAVVQVAGCTGSETSVRSTPCCYTCKPKPAIVRLRETTHDFEIHTLQAFAPAAPLSCSICSTLFRASLFSSSRGLQRCKRSTSISKLTAVCTILQVRSRSRPKNASACLNVKQALRQGRRQDVVISVCVSRRCGVGSYDDFGFVEDSPPPFMSLRGFLLQPTFSSILSRSPSNITAHACMAMPCAPRWSVSRLFCPGGVQSLTHATGFPEYSSAATCTPCIL